ncbi:MAG: vWA domain-containing protein [Trueperaceae bacterium]|nr:vWA domain-containing protein [Trueperaceae bacterium]
MSDGDRAGGRSDTRTVPAVPAERRMGVVQRVVGQLVPRRRHLRGTVYLLLDHSTSMGDPDKMTQMREGAVRFFLEAVQRGYAVGAVSFADRAALITGASLDAHRFWRRVHELRPYGRTAMARALRTGTGRLNLRRGRKVLVLITDGVPDDRDGTLEAARMARAAGITLIPIGTGNADHAFLAALAGRPELVRHVPRAAWAEAIAEVATGLSSGRAPG